MSVSTANANNTIDGGKRDGDTIQHGSSQEFYNTQEGSPSDGNGIRSGDEGSNISNHNSGSDSATTGNSSGSTVDARNYPLLQ